VKVGWISNKLGDVTTKIGSGATPLGGEKAYKETGICLIRSLNVHDWGFKENKLARIDEDQAERLSNVVVEPNDVLLNITDASVARCCLVPPEFLPARVNQHVSIIRPVKEKLLPAFLHYLLISKTYKDRLLHTGEEGGSTRQAITKAQLQQFVIEFPESLPEQQRIVGILDEAFDGIATAKANAEKNLQNARALFDSHLQSVLLSKKWRWITLGELCDGVEYGSSAKSKREGKVPVLRMGNIQDGQLDWENLVYTDDKDEVDKYLLKHNDVLFNRTNSPELVGKTAIYKNEMPAIFAGYLIRINRKEGLLDGDYLNYFLNSQIATDYGKTVVISSVNQANINGAKLKGYPIPAPSISEQRTIVKKLDGLQEETQRLKSLCQRKLTALDALKKSLLNQAFTGQLTARFVEEAMA
jgi:type I restriction enzyme S subunit